MSDQGAGKTRTVGIAVLPVCDAIECTNLADWFYKDQFGEVLLCAMHGGTEPAERWEWIGA